MLSDLVNRLRVITTKDQFRLIMQITKEDIAYHRSIGAKCTPERVAAVLSQSAILVKRL